MKTLQRYIGRELLFPFLMGVMIFSFILIMDKIFALTDLIVKYGVSLPAVGKLLVFIMPSTFAITIPIGCLIAVIVAFSRLKGDNEITALKASGISLLPVMLVPMIFGVGLTIAMVFFNNYLLPAANLAYKNLYYDIISQRAAIVIREHVFIDDFDGYSFRVGDVDAISGELKNVTAFALGRPPENAVRTILAKRGHLITDSRTRRVMLKLEDGFMQMVQPDNPQAYSRLEFQTNFLDLDIDHALEGQNQADLRSPREMSMGQIRRAIAKGLKSGENVNLLRVEFQKKLSIPFACLVFVLIGAPLGILSPRSGRFLAYFAGVLLIFMYYIFLSVGETFGTDGRMPAFLSMWLPNLLLAAVGAYGLVWVVQEHPPFWRRHSSLPPAPRPRT